MISTADNRARPPLTTEQWRRVFALVESPHAATTEGDAAVIDAVAFFKSKTLSEAPETNAFVGVADLLLGASTPTVGQRCGNYALIEPIGSGGMGSVWRARRVDGLYTQEVAVKLLGSLALSAQARARFAREGELLARLSHPNIARLIDAGVSDDGQRFLVLELIDGIDIASACAAKSQRDTLAVFRQLLSAVAYAHSQLVLHRDIKPANVLVDQNGVAKLLDFGVAKLAIEAEQDDGLTRAMGQALTERYAAPEQFCADGVSTAADVFALGSLLIELMSGEKVQWSHPKRQWMNPAISVTLSTSLDALPEDLQAVLRKSVARDATDRYASVSEFDDDVARFLAAEPVRARPASAWYRCRKFVQRNRRAVGAGVTAALAVMASLVFATIQLHQSRVQSRLAQTETKKAQEIAKFTTSLFTVLDPKVASPIDRSKLTAKQILDLGRERIRTELHDQPETRLALLGTLSEMYGRLEQEDAYLSLNEERRSIAQTLYGEHHPIVYDAQQSDLWSDLYSGNFASARATLEKLDTGANARGERGQAGDERAAIRLHAWAELMRASGAESGEPVFARFRRALAAFEKAKANSPDHAATLGNFGNSLAQSGDHAAAFAQFDQAIAMMHDARSNRAYVINEGDVYMLLRGRAKALQAMNRFDEAERDLRRGLALAIASSGVEHVLTKQTRAELAYLLHVTGRRDEAWREVNLIDATTTSPSANTSGMDQVNVLRARMLLAEARLNEAASLTEASIKNWRAANNNPARLREAEALLAEINKRRAPTLGQSLKQ